MVLTPFLSLVLGTVITNLNNVYSGSLAPCFLMTWRGGMRDRVGGRLTDEGEIYVYIS